MNRKSTKNFCTRRRRLNEKEWKNYISNLNELNLVVAGWIECIVISVRFRKRILKTLTQIVRTRCSEQSQNDEIQSSTMWNYWIHQLDVRWCAISSRFLFATIFVFEFGTVGSERKLSVFIRTNLWKSLSRTQARISLAMVCHWCRS